VQRLKVEIVAEDAKLRELSTQLGANHPDYLNAREHLASLRRQLEAEMSTVASGVRNVSNASQSRETSLRDAVAAQRGKILEMKQQRDQMSLLLHDADSAQRTLDAAMQRVSQIRLESQVNRANVSVLHPAIEPVYPSQPKFWLNTVLAIIIGANLAIGLAMLRELADRRVRCAGDLEIVSLPILGELLPGRGKRPRLLRFARLRLGAQRLPALKA
jgi:polysaccharide biosynthesis transport protein